MKVLLKVLHLEGLVFCLTKFLVLELLRWKVHIHFLDSYFSSVLSQFWANWTRFYRQAVHPSRLLRHHMVLQDCFLQNWEWKMTLWEHVRDGSPLVLYFRHDFSYRQYGSDWSCREDWVYRLIFWWRTILSCCSQFIFLVWWWGRDILSSFCTLRSQLLYLSFYYLFRSYKCWLFLQIKLQVIIRRTYFFFFGCFDSVCCCLPLAELLNLLSCCLFSIVCLFSFVLLFGLSSCLSGLALLAHVSWSNRLFLEPRDFLRLLQELWL